MAIINISRSSGGGSSSSTSSVTLCNNCYK